MLTNQDHPVAEVLLERRARASTPGRRTDSHRVVLAAEGGGMRGIISGAMLTALADYQLTSAFDAVYAHSAGAINAAYFVAGGGWQALAVYYDDLLKPEFIDFLRPLRNGPLLSLDYVLDEVMENRNPLNYAAVLGSTISLNVIVSDVDELRPVVLSGFSSKEELKWALRASASLPLMAGPPLVRGGKRYLDGGVLASHPIEAALADEPTHVVVMRTRADKRAETGAIGRRLLARRLDKYNYGLGQLFIEEQLKYSTLEAETTSASESWHGPPFILEVACPPAAHAVSRLTRDQGLLFGGLRAGYREMLRALFSKEFEVHLRPAIRSSQEAE